MNRQFDFDTKKNGVIVTMKNYNNDFFHWFFQHPNTFKITEYEFNDESLIIYNHTLNYVEKLFHTVYNCYIGYDD